MQKILLTFIFLASPILVWAEDKPATKTAKRQWHCLVDVGYALGGDDLASTQTTTINNNTVNSETLRAGEGLKLNAGIAYQIGETPWEVQGNLGFMVNAVDTDMGDFSFSRTTTDLMGFYRIRGVHRIGAGLTCHINPTMDLDLLGVGDLEFDTALGASVEYNYFLDIAYFGLRFTAIEYEADTLSGAKLPNAGSVDGNSLAGMIGIYW